MSFSWLSFNNISSCFDIKNRWYEWTTALSYHLLRDCFIEDNHLTLFISLSLWVTRRLDKQLISPYTHGHTSGSFQCLLQWKQRGVFYQQSVGITVLVIQPNTGLPLQGVYEWDIIPGVYSLSLGSKSFLLSAMFTGSDQLLCIAFILKDILDGSNIT